MSGSVSQTILGLRESVDSRTQEEYRAYYYPLGQTVVLALVRAAQMAITVFFSWQVDRPDGGERRLIEQALKDALKRIMADGAVEEAIRDEGIEVDRDTKGVPGTPPIVETIFAKIDRAAIFVPDLTFVCTRPDGRPAPNPNVLIEYGWALKTLTHSRMMPVMNTHYGRPIADSMPFDMRHLRNPLQFDLPPTADAALRRAIRDKLSKEFEAAIRMMIVSPEFAERIPRPPPFLAMEPKNGQARFRPERAPLGKTYEHFAQPSCDIFLAPGPAMWLRLMPITPQNRQWSTTELKDAATRVSKILLPLAAFGSSLTLSWIRGEDGFGIYAPLNSNITPTVVYIFHTGEIWSIDTYHPNANGGISLGINQMTGALDQYTKFLGEELGINPPYKVVAGIEGIKDKSVWIPIRPGQTFIKNPFGSCIQDSIIHTTTYEPHTSSRDSLRVFFETILEKCGFDNMSVL